jgi:TRAP-type C4-dicarboxylate transport system permease small subunit
MLIFSILILIYGWKLALMQVQTQQKTIIMQIPLVYIFSILPLMGAMMLIRTTQVIYQDIAELRTATKKD